MTDKPPLRTQSPKGHASYDPEADAIGVYFKPEGAEYEESEEIAPGVVLDYDKQGRVIGVELLHVRQLLSCGSLTNAVRKHSGGSVSDDPDDAPELTEAFFDEAEYFHGNTFLGKGRGLGCPKLDAVREQISVRLDPDVLANLREAGPGWQTQINTLLRQALRLEA